MYVGVGVIFQGDGDESYNGVQERISSPAGSEESLRLFARDVAAELRKHVAIEDQLIARAGAGEAAAAHALSLPPS